MSPTMQMRLCDHLHLERIRTPLDVREAVPGTKVIRKLWTTGGDKLKLFVKPAAVEDLRDIAATEKRFMPRMRQPSIERLVHKWLTLPDGYFRRYYVENQAGKKTFLGSISLMPAAKYEKVAAALKDGTVDLIKNPGLMDLLGTDAYIELLIFNRDRLWKTHRKLGVRRALIPFIAMHDSMMEMKHKGHAVVYGRPVHHAISKIAELVGRTAIGKTRHGNIMAKNIILPSYARFGVTDLHAIEDADRAASTMGPWTFSVHVKGMLEAMHSYKEGQRQRIEAAKRYLNEGPVDSGSLEQKVKDELAKQLNDVEVPSEMTYSYLVSELRTALLRQHVDARELYVRMMALKLKYEYQLQAVKVNDLEQGIRMLEDWKIAGGSPDKPLRTGRNLDEVKELNSMNKVLGYNPTTHIYEAIANWNELPTDVFNRYVQLTTVDEKLGDFRFAAQKNREIANGIKEDKLKEIENPALRGSVRKLLDEDSYVPPKSECDWDKMLSEMLLAATTKNADEAYKPVKGETIFSRGNIIFADSALTEEDWNKAYGYAKAGSSHS